MSEHFIEWLAPTAPMPDCERLVQLQLQLASWHCQMSELWSDGAQRRGIAEAAHRLADEVLGMSVLLVAGAGS